MSTPSAFEQLMLEYINRARLDPQGEFDRFIVSTEPVQAIESKITSALNYFGVDLNLYQQQLATLTPVAPLAWNSALNVAATAHSQLMIDQDAQSHQLSGEAGLGARISAAGYDHWDFLAENIYAYTQSPAYGHAGFFIDWGGGNGGMQNPAGHRINIMRENLTEVGIGVVNDTSGSTSVGPYVVTQDFGNRWDYDAQFVGVAYDDNDADAFYSMGEGMGGVVVTVTPLGGGSSSTVAHSAGGYQIEGVIGINNLTFTGGGLSGSTSVDVVFSGDNVKVDLVDGTRIESSSSAILGGGSVDLTLLGQQSLWGYGNALGNKLIGNLGDNLLDGFDGDDSLLGNGGDDILVGGGGEDTLSGGNGQDTVKGNTGNDTIHGGEGDDWLHGGKQDDLLRGDAGADTIFGGLGNDTLHGNHDDDSLQGGDGDDWMHGGKNDDWLDGGPGSDTVFGGKGNDMLFGGAGDDVLSGGPGLDYLDGGAGNDIFDFSALSDSPSGAGNRDIIVAGFDNPGSLTGDMIDVADIGLFVFLGSANFSDHGEAELRVTDEGGNALVQGDLDGDGLADFEVVVENVLASSFGADDFFGLI